MWHFFISSIISLGLTSFVSAVKVEAQPTLPESAAKMRFYDITRKGMVRFTRYTNQNSNAQQPLTFFLHRNGGLAKNAVLVIEADGTPKLNPEGFVYGPIPPLGEITLLQAAELWSQNPELYSADTQTNSFAFESSGKKFEIDCQFKGDHISQYKVRSADIYVKQGWIAVKRGEEERKRSSSP